MRSKRERKHRKRFKTLAIGTQILLIWTSLIIVGTQINSYTNASFNDIEDLTASLDVAEGEPPGDGIWDRSSLEFSANGYGFCTEGIKGLFSDLINSGDGDMAGKSLFEVHYVEDGPGPNKNHPGTVIYQGEIKALKSNELTRLIYAQDLDSLAPGKYKFKAYHRPGHGDPNNNNPDADLKSIWGEQTITISQADIEACKPANPVNNFKETKEPKATKVGKDAKSNSEEEKTDAPNEKAPASTKKENEDGEVKQAKSSENTNKAQTKDLDSVEKPKQEKTQPVDNKEATDSKQTKDNKKPRDSKEAKTQPSQQDPVTE